MDYIKNSDLFVGIDSDGTVFDSMTIKHTFSCVPAAIKLFGLESVAKEFTKIEERINLYSMTRGINRFPGLYLCFEELDKAALFTVKDYRDLKKFIDSGFPLSNDGLKKYIDRHMSKFLERVLRWSIESDKLFQKACGDLEPFSAAYEAIAGMSKAADIMVVSAASSEGLLKDWTRTGLIESVGFVAGQEFGSKTSQLEYAKNMGYSSKSMLMIGDAPGDYNAAKALGVRFYPIMPRHEEESWEALKNKYFAMFASGEYSEEIENSLYSEFINSLEEPIND